jgi:phage terminase Nu1 subunit (DNA packaging protein)
MATIAQSAQHLFLSTTRFKELVEKGVIQRKGTDGYDLDEVRKSYITYQRTVAAGRLKPTDSALDLSAERAKLAKEQTEAISIKNALARGDLVPTKAVAEFMTHDYSLVAERIQAIPGKLADKLASPEHPRHVVEEALRYEINEALNELHDPASFGAISIGGVPDDIVQGTGTDLIVAK